MNVLSVCGLFTLVLYLDQASSADSNFIVILTDDQDIVLNGLNPMENVRKLLANRGALFTNAFTSSPICCPSRASILSGQYAHNHETKNNSRIGGCYGSHWQEKIEPTALPVHLQRNGYETFYAGKYLNEYFSETIPPGWSQWYGLHGNSAYFNYTLNENGVMKKYDNDYLTDVLNTKALEFLSNAKKPFFAMIAPPAPHMPCEAAERHSHSFENIKALRTPNFNIPSGVLDKHWLLRMPPATLNNETIEWLDTIYRKRWQSLLAVDDMVANIIHTLEEKHLYDDTYIIYTSDNGYHVGQFGQAIDKRQPYETDIRVPFVISGPKIPPKIVYDYPVALIDIFPSVLTRAGIPLPDFVDGQSFFATNENDETVLTNDYGNRQILIEYWGEGDSTTYSPECKWHKGDRLSQCSIEAECHCQDAWNNTYSCIRQTFVQKEEHKIFCEFQDRENFVEAYDLSVDPYEMTNIAFDMLPSEHALLSLALEKLAKCKGDSCRQIY
ncbi:N-acetylglucosamine-6-sulfatase-like [Bradysia coprophila]|uniref:N-acetylglucosamine-6-sulfatase-like n=1 Tax=Bradysia coprophila TaxID=38358 RepID=UPI00187D84AF|nr:N-acetylglucosamine-6-sulfatase-like [Bradysia coprophila]